mmetsp:Transcript_32562/g.29419  ORF Transcript_32562/g.29419 Transcript_32562/m.29419 type:complete len:126 (-) Transcript_32562:122-499(-)|eukprot:CAMPEP_0114577236 /NCGR_PEP_ID=MMETSP0125-20121206/1918_1 /TAXON_ID=485358 ORGANISM="Aristerostoma sp., Strain ATCC 50986" /NCGR_SAMPLE_ID=MMETSP0125 /ASSEMBLY_ACC=CAM_ASM_000245 /LENGTH=125 /DNA_ID=CAMNT_0001766389 /DNA_START=98 /DNA_END=475 /DNA_ORIENTATION=+
MVCQLIAYHSEYKLDDLAMDINGPCFAVDSGQGCIFEATHYRDASVIEGNPKSIYGESNKFYGAVCDITLGEVEANKYYGCMKYGIVSQSGGGNGGYQVYLSKNGDGKVVGVKVVYITDEEVEEF